MLQRRSAAAIVIRGARQNNLKNLSLELPLNELVVVTGVSGSGKSSLVFDTLYAEGQRRYVETFSPYARQFLDRMDKPQVDAIEGIPPAIAIDQTNPVRTSRSTVGTMTELNDHLKLLFARAGSLYCRGCARPVRRDTPDSVYEELSARARAENPRLVLTFPVTVPKNFKEGEVQALLKAQGYDRIHARTGNVLDVVQDRLRFSPAEKTRLIEAIESAFRIGQGKVNVYPLDAEGNPLAPWRFSSDLHCPDCDIHYSEPSPALFSFNSPLGACETCRGFGRVIGIDYGLIVPDEAKTLREGAVRPWQSPSFHECQDDLEKYAKKRGVPLDVPFRDLAAAQRKWVLEGEPEWVSWRKSWPGTWYGVARFFRWLETKAYKMHVRVLLSRYRAYSPCPACRGARLKPDALAWRVGTKEDADRALDPALRFMPHGAKFDEASLHGLPGLTLHDLVLLPAERTRAFFESLHLPWAPAKRTARVQNTPATGAASASGVASPEGAPAPPSGAPIDDATDLLLTEIRARLRYLHEVGLGYLTLDRQSRTLSGGEVQRINLTTALGTSLVNTLFVLDEPSIGLHPRDMGRVIGVMQRLRDAGNSLVVVEHDPQIMLAADRILDMGPGPGERGGEIVFFGSPEELKGAKTLTAEYLSGRKLAGAGDSSPPRTRGSGGVERRWVPASAGTTAKIELLGAAEHNLKSIDVRVPLERLVCITGVSGSGKSTLIQDVLYAALRRAKGKPTETPGEFVSLKGAEHVGDVVMVDQTPIGRTTRSNPASYVGAWDAIRGIYAREVLAKERKYTAGTFSFNSGKGRCPTCGGNGFEHVEMQFLSDVYLRCPDCSGKRFRAEVLEVTVAGKSIADALELTVSEALAFFRDHAEVGRALKPLADVGLEYLRLGQPVPTLSGGEAQRLKLAGHLVEAAVVAPAQARAQPRPKSLDSRLRRNDESKGKLFLFDEPTTGLHFEDVAKLLGAFRQLLAAGHSIVVIEHNLDVIRASDWIIDLGPEGGEAGGEIVCAGAPGEVAKHATSHTGRALREYEAALAKPAAPAVREPEAPLRARFNGTISVRHAREHNLKNIDVEIPRGRFTVVTGVSGSGKSTLAFDILFAEGQRRYLESLNAYARQFVQGAVRPDVDAIFGIPPTVAIEQRTSRGGRKSTVATLTEIYHFLRLLYVKLGVQHCPDCKVPIEPQSEDAIAARLLREHKGQRVGLLAPLVVNRKGYYTDLAKWAAGRGYTHLRVDGEFLPTDKWPRLSRFQEHTLELPVADLRIASENEIELRRALSIALEHGKGVVHVLQDLDRLAQAAGKSRSSRVEVELPQRVFSTKRACSSCARSFADLDPRLFSFNSKHGWCAECYGTGLKLSGVDWDEEREKTGTEDHVLDSWLEWLEIDETCPACHGMRLNLEALAVLWRGRSISDLAALPVAALKTLFREVRLAGRDAEIARDIVAELRSRLDFLDEVGLSYLSLDRAAPTLSGGEAQRIRLASQLGSNLRGVCYILDEPTIGLHPRDNAVLLDTLEKLEAKGNTLVVVEHDEETIRRAEHLIDLGPGAGRLGGRVIAQGSVADLMRESESVTGRFLAHPLKHPLHAPRLVRKSTASLQVTGASQHNLADIDVRVPLARLSVITGVSGSGKSTLARDVLYENLRRLVQGKDAHKRRTGEPRGSPVPPPSGCRGMRGAENVGRVLEVDQTPIGKTPRSCPATYVGFWDSIRRLFAETVEARMRGWSASRFSFNVKGGRCESCEGQGIKRIEMSFLPDVKVACEACRGARFNPETLAVRWKGKNAGEVLAMSVDNAVEFFSAHPATHRALRLLQDVGLGYLTLGQQSPTLSGGEAQRIKLVTELARTGDGPGFSGKPAGRRPGSGPGFLILDEPTVGLHMADVEKLVRVLHRLVDAGNTVVVIEHNLDVIAEGDWIIDLGPEGGAAGGRVVAQGEPEQVVAMGRVSHTAVALANFLENRRAGSAVHES
jgi:excinuclease ABC subunit A